MTNLRRQSIEYEQILIMTKLELVYIICMLLRKQLDIRNKPERHFKFLNKTFNNNK